MNIADFLSKKFLEWQMKEGERKTIEEFAEYLGVPRSLLSLWMSGLRQPGPKYKKPLMDKYGDEAAAVLGEDPRLFWINEHWDEASEELQKAIHKQLQNGLAKNDAQRLAKRREKANH